MTKEVYNPWKNMTESSQRRIDSETLHNLFWMTDLHGNYGFYLRRNRRFETTENITELKGISVIKRNSQDGAGELFLLLKNKEEWHLFFSLCEDLIAVAHRYSSEDQMISTVEIRLQRWQQLLKQDIKRKMPLEKQMGLFTELLCLKDVVAPKVGIRQAVFSWVGPDFDRQDFLLDNSVIEVKSYNTSKSSVIHVSSVLQLHSEKKKLFLISYALSQSNNGMSIKDMEEVIKSLLDEEEAYDAINNFDSKLIEYGYIPEIIREPLHHFIVDNYRVFLVSKKFPKIIPSDITSQIISVKYSIDLSKCSQHEVMRDSFLNGEYKNG